MHPALGVLLRNVAIRAAQRGFDGIQLSRVIDWVLPKACFEQLTDSSLVTCR